MAKEVGKSPRGFLSPMVGGIFQRGQNLSRPFKEGRGFITSILDSPYRYRENYRGPGCLGFQPNGLPGGARIGGLIPAIGGGF